MSGDHVQLADCAAPNGNKPGTSSDRSGYTRASGGIHMVLRNEWWYVCMLVCMFVVIYVCEATLLRGDTLLSSR